MEMLPPAPVPPNVVVGATIVKRFPGYGEHRGTIAEIDLDGGKVVVRWATDESTISLGRRRAAGAARAKAQRARPRASLAEAPPRRVGRRRAVAARPPPLGFSKDITTTV